MRAGTVGDGGGARAGAGRGHAGLRGHPDHVWREDLDGVVPLRLRLRLRCRRAQRTGAGVGARRRVGRGGRGAGAQLGDGSSEAERVADTCDTHGAEGRAGHVAQDLAGDVVLGKEGSVRSEAVRSEPSAHGGMAPALHVVRGRIHGGRGRRGGGAWWWRWRWRWRGRPWGAAAAWLHARPGWRRGGRARREALLGAPSCVWRVARGALAPHRGRRARRLVPVPRISHTAPPRTRPVRNTRGCQCHVRAAVAPPGIECQPESC